MKLPYKWAQSYADIHCPPQEFSDRMTMTGSKVETFDSEADTMQGVVIGRIATITRHPDSDHLWICAVDVGTGTVQIVTGAQNLKEGDIVPAALHGAKLPNGMTIKRGKLRGEVSDGMLCSLDELHLTLHDFPHAVEDGILVLDPAEYPAVPGEDAAAALGMDDIVFDFEITPNRPDCLSVRGLAREAAATFGVPFKDTQPQPPEGILVDGSDVKGLLDARIEAVDTCLRYSAAVVENVRIAPSPRWMRERLRAAGVRPINNIVDITNYVMLEYGQPMHAFDYAYVKGADITVRMAKPGESIVTLDDVERKLDPAMMVIADAEGPIAIAGIMGGEYSGVYDTTTRVVFESACFDGPSVRATSKRLGLRTESSGRYEKGLDPNLAGPALRRALQLVRELDAGDVVQGVIDDYPRPREALRVPLRVDAINRLLGINIPQEEMENILLPLGFEVEGMEVLVPSSRYDVERYNDLAEEIARFVGYNKIPSTVMGGIARARRTPRQTFEGKITAQLVGYGMWQCETFSFYSPRVFDLLHLPAGSPLRDVVAITNPLGEETSIMRTTALPSVLEVAGRNWAARNETAALFEMATEYLPAPAPDDLPTERKKAVLCAYGEGWDYARMKGVVENLLDGAGVKAYSVHRNAEGAAYHPGRCADIMLELGDDGKGARRQVRVATVGEIHPLVRENYGIKPRLVAAEVYLDALFEARGGTPQYTPLPRFPAITRDLAVVAPEALPASEIAGRIKKAGGKLLESLSLFDVYTGEGLGAGNKSLAYALVLRDAGATLTDEDATRVTEKILKSLSEIGVKLRG